MIGCKASIFFPLKNRMKTTNLEFEPEIITHKTHIKSGGGWTHSELLTWENLRKRAIFISNALSRDFVVL